VIPLALLIPLVCASGWFIWQDYHVRHNAIVTEVCQKSALVNAELEKFVSTVKGVAGLYAFSWARRYPPMTGHMFLGGSSLIRLV
jgi:hypothetical protein